IVVYFRLVERDVRARGIELRDSAVVVRFLGLSLLLGNHTLGRIAPPLVCGLGKVGLRLPYLYLRLRSGQFRASRGKLRIQFRRVDDGKALASVYQIANVDVPLCDIPADTSVDGTFIPSRGFSR